MQKPPKLIAIHGLKGSGKDLTATMLKKFALNSNTFSFGDKLKSICVAATGISPIHFYDETLKEKPCLSPSGAQYTPRNVMTSMQGPLKEVFGDDFFARDVVGEWAVCLKSGRNLIVTDLRFPVELAVLRDLGAHVLHVHRPVSTYSDFSHVSEKGLPLWGFDYLLQNSGDKASLLQEVRTYVQYLWGPDALHAYPFVPSEIVEF